MATPTKSPLLEWRRTEISGRVASYGVGGSGPPVVFLHGWGLSGHTYKAALKRLLALGFQVITNVIPVAMDARAYAATERTDAA